MLQYSQMPSCGISLTIRSFRFGLVKLPLSSLLHVLRVVASDMILECVNQIAHSTFEAERSLTPYISTGRTLKL